MSWTKWKTVLFLSKLVHCKMEKLKVKQMQRSHFKAILIHKQRALPATPIIILVIFKVILLCLKMSVLLIYFFGRSPFVFCHFEHVKCIVTSLRINLCFLLSKQFHRQYIQRLAFDTFEVHINVTSFSCSTFMHSLGSIPCDSHCRTKPKGSLWGSMNSALSMLAKLRWLTYVIPIK